MSERLLKNWRDKKWAVEDAKEWNDLPNGKKYSENDTFKINVESSKAPRLVRCGQQYHGGKTRWETDPEFNKAILEYLVRDWDDHFPKIFEIMVRKEIEALRECEDFINEMKAEIDKVK